MKKTIAAATLAAAAIIAAPAAQASPGLAPETEDNVAAYLYVLHKRGISASSGDSNLVANGEKICRLIGNGRSPMSVALTVYRNTDASITAEDSGYIVGAAVTNLCSEYRYLLPTS